MAWRDRRRTTSAGLAAIAVVATTACAAAQPPGDVPARDAVGTDITCYRPLTRRIATGGLIKGDGVGALKSFGFATILDVRDPDEGIEPERRAAAAAGIRYINLPFTQHVPPDPVMDEFARIVEDAGNHPLLVHCVSANRVGVMWTLYQVRRGVPVATAIAEGRAIGMKPAREHFVRRHLGLPGCTDTCPPP